MSYDVVSDEVVFLGTKGGPSIRNIGPSTMPTSTLIDIGRKFRIIVDCGIGVTRAIRESGRAVDSITHVFLTHYHSDHILELGGLLSTAWACGLNHEVHLFGPEGLKECWEGVCQMLKVDLAVRQVDEGRPDLTKLIKLHTCGEGVIWREGELVVQAMKNLHPPLDNSYAFRFDCGWRRSVFVSGDTAYYPPLVDFCRGCDLVVHEAMLESGVDWVVSQTGNTDHRLKEHLLGAHTLARDAAAIAHAAGCRKLVLHHLIPPERDIAPDSAWLREARADHPTLDVQVSFDGMVVKFGPDADASPVSTSAGQTLSRLVDAARDSQQFKRTRKFHGLTLAKYEEFCVFVLLVAIGAKEAYLVDGMSFGAGQCSCCRSAEECISSLLLEVRGVLVEAFAAAPLTCIGIEQEEAWTSVDHVVIRTDTLNDKLLELQCSRKSSTEDSWPSERLARKHPLLVDVGATDLKLLENSVVSQLCGILSDFIPKGKAETYEYCKLLRQDAVLDSCGVCFVAGWVLGYPCVYRSVNQSGEGASNALSMRMLRQSRITIPTEVLLALPLGGGSACPPVFPQGGYLREREEVAILEFTVPVELLDMDVGIGSRYSKAIDDLLGKTTRALNGVKLSSNDVQIASVTM